MRVLMRAVGGGGCGNGGDFGGDGLHVRVGGGLAGDGSEGDEGVSLSTSFKG